MSLPRPRSPHALDPVKRFERWHETMLRRRNVDIPHAVLRAYLDSVREARYTRPGLHNVTVTITREAALGLLRESVLTDPSVELRVQGGKYHG